MDNKNINEFKTISELEKYRQEINEACDSRAKFIRLCEKASKLGDRKFLDLKESFENMSPLLFESEDGKKIINKYTSTIKSSKNLKSLHALYENIRKASNLVDTDYFVKNITECNWGINKNTLPFEVKKLGRVLSEAYLYLGDKADELVSETRQELSNAVEYIAENAKTTKNIAEYSEAVKIIKECIEKQEDYHVLKESSLSSIAENLVENFNRNFSDTLSDDDKELIKEVSTSNKQVVFAKYKDLCLSKINEVKTSDKDEDTVNRLNAIEEQVNKKEYKEESFADDILSLREMVNVLMQ